MESLPNRCDVDGYLVPEPCRRPDWRRTEVVWRAAADAFIEPQRFAKRVLHRQSNVDGVCTHEIDASTDHGPFPALYLVSQVGEISDPRERVQAAHLPRHSEFDAGTEPGVGEAVVIAEVGLDTGCQGRSRDGPQRAYRPFRLVVEVGWIAAFLAGQLSSDAGTHEHLKILRRGRERSTERDAPHD